MSDKRLNLSNEPPTSTTSRIKLPSALGPIVPGDVVRRPGYEFEVLQARNGRPQRARIRFDRPLAEIDLGQFVREDGWKLHRVPL